VRKNASSSSSCDIHRCRAPRTGTTQRGVEYPDSSSFAVRLRRPAIALISVRFTGFGQQLCSQHACNYPQRRLGARQVPAPLALRPRIVPPPLVPLALSQRFAALAARRLCTLWRCSLRSDDSIRWDSLYYLRCARGGDGRRGRRGRACRNAALAPVRRRLARLEQRAARIHGQRTPRADAAGARGAWAGPGLHAPQVPVRFCRPWCRRAARRAACRASPRAGRRCERAPGGVRRG